MERNRLASLDILRGFDLWLLLFFGSVIGSYCSVAEGPVRDFIHSQTEHPEWTGFVLWDIIMPLFMFMSGATIPFSMARYREGEKPGRAFWCRLARRFVLLFFLGWIVQGNLLTLQWHLIHPFANTLQAIAVAYVVAAVSYSYGGVRTQLIVSVLCFVAYFLLFACNGQLIPDIQDNVAMWVDQAILGSHRDGVIWADDGSWTYDSGYRYTWIVSSLNFAVTGIMGCLTGHVLRNGSRPGQQRTMQILVVAILLIVAGLALGEVFPINKKIWNSSMTLYSGGICCCLLALTYYIVDVCGWSRGLNWLKYYGMNSILAYCIGEVVNFSSVSGSLLYGLQPICGDYYRVLQSFANACILLVILRILYKRQIFLKV